MKLEIVIPKGFRKLRPRELTRKGDYEPVIQDGYWRPLFEQDYDCYVRLHFIIRRIEKGKK